MKVSFIESARDHSITEDATVDLPWPELRDRYFSEHLVTEVKDGWAFLLNEYDMHGKRNDQEYVRRCKENVIAVNGLVFDVDGGWTLDESLEVLSAFTHTGNTTWSHQLPDKHGIKHEKFRLVVPFSDGCPTVEFVARVPDLKRMFPKVDDASFTVSQLFYLPACPAATQHLAQTWSNEGETFDWRWLKAEPIKPVTPRRVVTPDERAKLVKEGQGRVLWETFDIVAFMRDQGLYIKHLGHGKHSVRCPNPAGHDEDGSTVIWETGGFNCFHAKCAGFQLSDHFAQTLGKSWKVPYCLREREASALVSNVLKEHDNELKRKVARWTQRS